LPFLERERYVIYVQGKVFLGAELLNTCFSLAQLWY
jgi:hypothetical protein